MKIIPFLQTHFSSLDFYGAIFIRNTIKICILVCPILRKKAQNSSKLKSPRISFFEHFFIFVNFKSIFSQFLLLILRKDTTNTCTP